MKYIANPVEVDAFVIQRVATIINDNRTYCTLEDGREVSADAGMTARYFPKPGDYWVVQEDGYEYLNPGFVFERKYHLKPPDVMPIAKEPA